MRNLLSGEAAPLVSPRQGGPDPGDRRGEERVGRGAPHPLLQQAHAAHEDEARQVSQRLIVIIGWFIVFLISLHNGAMMTSDRH